MENYQKLPSSILSIKNRCTKHGNRYEFYFSRHGAPCCASCIIRDDHRYCKELRPIHEVTEDAKSSTAIAHIERDLKDIDCTFEKIKSNIEKNISNIHKKKKKFVSDISDMRKSLNEHLDKIEKQTIEEMLLAEQKLQGKLKNVLIVMEIKRTYFDNIRQDVNKVKKYASDLQTFIGVNEMTNVVNGEVKKQKGAFNYDLFELKLDFLQELESFVKEVSIFGVISVAEVHYSTSLTTGAELQAHSSEPQLTRKTTVNFQTKVKGRVSITGCDILPNGKLVFADQEDKLLMMFSNNGNYEKDIIRFSYKPYEVSCTGENIVAITICSKGEVVFVNVITNTITNTLYIGHACYGIDFTMNRLAIQAVPVFTSSRIVYLDPKGQLIEGFNISAGFSRNISLRDGTIKRTGYDTIYCYSLTGQTIWDFRDRSVLRKAKGIALDKNSNVFVAGMETNNVVVLSSDGKNCRQILSKSDGLNEPFSLRINIDRSELLVCNTNGQAFLFSLQYI